MCFSPALRCLCSFQPWFPSGTAWSGSARSSRRRPGPGIRADSVSCACATACVWTSPSPAFLTTSPAVTFADPRQRGRPALGTARQPPCAEFLGNGGNVRGNGSVGSRWPPGPQFCAGHVGQSGLRSKGTLQKPRFPLPQFQYSKPLQWREFSNEFAGPPRCAEPVCRIPLSAAPLPLTDRQGPSHPRDSTL